MSIRAQVCHWASIFGLLPLAGWSVAASSVLVNLVIGLLPTGFIIGAAVMLDRVTAIGVGRSADAWSGVVTAFLITIGALLLQNAFSPFQAAIGELATRRVDGHCIQRLVRAGLNDAPMAMLERREVLDQFSLARQGLTERGQTPGAAVAGLLALTARYTQIIGAVVLAGVVLGPLSGVALGLTAAVIRFSSRGSLTRWSAAIKRSFEGQWRKKQYLLDTGSDLAAAKEIRVLGLLPWLHSRVDSELTAFLRPMWRERRRIYFTPFLFFTAVMLAGTVVVLLQLSRAILAGDVSVLGLSLAIQAILVPLRMGTLFPESDLQTMFGMLSYTTIADLEDQFARAGERQDPSCGEPLPDGLPHSVIRFEGVGFRYPGSDHAILTDLDLELKVGTSTAIVGLNGAGKTTLVKLLARLYEPTAGRITLDGHDIREFAPAAWQRRLAVIFQDYVRYELDVAANIGLGSPTRLDDQAALLAAARRAGADEVIASLPAGLGTPLSSRYVGGVDLSGGQWQRVALARALFAVGSGASILVLDEPTAQLDVRAEVAFYDRFLELTNGMTTIVISHRFSSVRNADRIVVLEDGRLRESGTHDELVLLGGRYATLFRLQAQRFSAIAPTGLGSGQ